MSPKAIKVDPAQAAKDRATAYARKHAATAPRMTVVSDTTETTTDDTGKVSRRRTITKIPRAVFRLFVEEEIATLALHIIIAAISALAGAFGLEWIHHLLH
jgi:hypothetical protein